MESGTHIDILDTQEPLRPSFYSSLLLHGIMAAVIGITAIWQGGGRSDTFGDPNAIPGGTAITPVASIPVINPPSRFNPVANDTESLVPQRTDPPKPEPDEDDAVRLGKKDQKKKKKSLDLAAYLRARNKAFEQLKENQSGSSTGAAASSPIFGKPGTGGVGLGDGNPFGSRFGGYAALLRDCVVRKWNTSDVDSGLRTAPTVIIGFQILRNGAARDIRVIQRSGNTALDYSCQRAIVDCSPFPPLPAEFERDSANIEFQFLLKR